MNIPIASPPTAEAASRLTHHASRTSPPTAEDAARTDRLEACPTPDRQDACPTSDGTPLPGSRRRAFTLIELLVVIAVIAILAGLVVYILPGVSEKRVRTRVNAEMAAIITAIDSYHQKRGFYPPDNPNDPAKPPLYHELTGTDLNPALSNQFGVAGIINGGTDTQNFFPNVKPGALYTLAEISPNDPSPTNRATALVVPAKGPATPMFPSGEPNLWRYDSSNPRFNSESFDLWAEVVVRGKTNIIGNWK